MWPIDFRPHVITRAPHSLRMLSHLSRLEHMVQNRECFPNKDQFIWAYVNTATTLGYGIKQVSWDCLDEVLTILKTTTAPGLASIQALKRFVYSENITDTAQHLLMMLHCCFYQGTEVISGQWQNSLFTHVICLQLYSFCYRWKRSQLYRFSPEQNKHVWKRPKNRTPGMGTFFSRNKKKLFLIKNWIFNY